MGSDEREGDRIDALQQIMDSTDEMIDCIRKMDWDRIESLGEHIAESAQTLKILSSVN